MKRIITLSMCALLVACGGVDVVDLNDQKQVSEMENVMDLEYRDWTKTAESMTEGMLNSGAFDKVKNPVIAISDVENDTMQRFDTDILIKKIRTTLVNSGKAQVTTALKNKKGVATAYVPVTAEMEATDATPMHSTSVKTKAEGYAPVQYETKVAEDDVTNVVRENRDNKEFKAGTIAKQGTLIAPNLSLSGKMLQRNIKLEGGMFSSKKERVEYYLQLTLTDVETGLSVWEGEEPIVKEGKHAPTW